MDAGTSRKSRVSPMASTRRNRGDANMSRASTDAPKASVSRRSVSRSSVSLSIDDNLAYLLTEGVKADEGPIPKAPEDP